MTSARLPLVIGHRGAPGYRPEHTLPSYELAIALGADAVEPDIVASRDGILVLRHENEISGTTDVASRAEFASRRTTKTIDEARQTGWFTEDFTWAELSTLRSRERLPKIRQSSASYDLQSPIMRLSELLHVLDRAREESDRPIGLVAEIKHAAYFDSIGLPLDELVAAELTAAGWNSDDGRLTVESFEKTVLDQLRSRGLRSKNVFLLEAAGSPPDLVARFGADADSYASFLTRDGLRMLRRDIEGISVDRRMILPRTDPDSGAVSSVLVDDAHAAGLEIYSWTLRPENRFLDRALRRGSDPSAFGDWQRDFALILATGVDGVFADHVDLAIAARNAASPSFEPRGTVGGSA
ncbi:glycerophosphodiester phosphodiesterase family protein [Agreia sp. VKM Ac-1783]|uniref:glycerophosphodiester phosphodiesterase family protein n=1 Tax=Agreia sp. VKM Ac-1783 TaxID=1938889 RepID=UPI002016796F|nr:glycerophosphodiester phosphodiesterase family protein [Agreia sp. VKM Ac-1783]